ncbi:MAG: GNAT family N-acetyltransferase [Thermotogota bacterium]
MPLEGTLVVLREERREDQKLFAELRNDLATQAWGQSLPPTYTEEMHVKRFEAMEFSYQRTSARLPIVHKETGEIAGYISYTDLEPRFSTSIGLVVAKPFWGDPRRTRCSGDAAPIPLLRTWVARRSSVDPQREPACRGPRGEVRIPGHGAHP